MKTVTAWVQIRLDFDENEPARLAGRSLLEIVKDYVEDGSSDVLTVGSTEVRCCCGGDLPDITESCSECIPERQEWFENDKRG